jgi:hypothetical protein
VFADEHGPTFDDEVNLLGAGRNYGWDPSKGGTVNSYIETVPITDTMLLFTLDRSGGVTEVFLSLPAAPIQRNLRPPPGRPHRSRRRLYVTTSGGDNDNLLRFTSA